MKSITQTTAAHILAKGDGEWLGDHTIGDLKVSERLLDNLPFYDQRLCNYLQLGIAFHDVGKTCEGFQQALKPGVPYWPHRHEIISSVFAGMLGLPPEVIMAILTHHKDLSPEGLEDDKGCLHYEDIPLSPDDISPSWIELIKEFNVNLPALRNDWTQICNYINRPDLINFSPLTQLSSLANYRDWVIRRRQVRNIPFAQRYFVSLLRGLLISSDHIASSGAEMPVKIPDLKTYDLISSSSFLQRLHGYQELAMYKTGNLILRAPTGSGKTLAALFWGQTNQQYNGRLFYVLPTQASINAMYLRLRKYFTGERVVGLLHSRVASSIYSMYEEGDLGSRLANQHTSRMIKSLMKEMYYPVRVCTPHQILRYSLMGKGWEMMLSEFPNSCFVFDEIHSYDPLIVGLVLATAKFVIKLGASVMFLSATLPSFIRRLIEKEIPSINFIQPDPIHDKQILEQKRHRIVTKNGNTLDNIDLIVNQARRVKSTLVACNHVTTSQIVYEQLKERIEGVVLLHSRFNRRDRNMIENTVMKKLPKILVSTQVIEVSLDLDFRQAFSECAPIDAIVQRMGRVNRYGKRKPALVRIFRKEVYDGKYKIYDPEIVTKSLEVLHGLSGKTVSEEDLNEAAETVYRDGYNQDQMDKYLGALNHPRISNFEKDLVAGTHSDFTDIIIEEMEGKTDLLPTSLVREYNELDSQGLKLEAEDLLVPVRKRLFGRFIKDQIIDTTRDPWTIDMPYLSESGLML